MDDAVQTDAGARRRAFRESIEPEIPVLLRVGRSLTRNDADAEDLVQETLIRAFRGLDGFDGRHPRAWLLTILRRTNSNQHRRRRPVIVEDEDLHAGTPAFGPERHASAEESYLREHLDERLRRAMADLDQRFRDVVLLVDVHDLSYQEAAATLDVPVGTVMSRLHRARRRLRGALDHQLPDRGEA